MGTSPRALAAAAALSVTLIATGVSAQDVFTTSIQPLIEARCVRCHGPDKQKADLRLDSRARMLRGGERGPALVPGDVGASLIARAIRYDDLELEMPPKGRLPQGEIDALTAWIADGAPGPTTVAEVADLAEAGDEAHDDFDLAARMEHWSFQPLADPAPPAVSDRDWARDPVDDFVLAGLEGAGLSPAPEADRRTWLRRLSLDLIGLPPAPERVERFVADSSPGAHTRVVRELLDGPGFGERWARHHLDLVRYAETRGHEFDFAIPNAWEYRDYVIRALDADVPYDEFVREHLAGDLIEPPRLHPGTGAEESVLGTGFWALGEEVHSPVDIRGDQVDRYANQVDVVGRAFLGLTVACARCHDHKFDPIPASDFYSLMGFRLSADVRQVRFETRRDNAALSRQFERLHATQQPALRQALVAMLRAELDGLPPVIEAAAAALREGPVAVEAGASAPDDIDLLFADFEDGSFEGWVPEGEAFGIRPLRHGEYDAELGARGGWHVQSWMAERPGETRGRDDLTGTLTSPAFTIERDFIHLLVGGGLHDEVGVRLLVDEQVVGEVHGLSRPLMQARRFDVASLRGRQARLVAYDDHLGGWGQVSFDHVVFSDSADAERALGVTERPAVLAGWWRAAQAAGAERGADVRRVMPWLRRLRAGDDPLLWPLGARADGIAVHLAEPLALTEAEPITTLFDAQATGGQDVDWRVDGPTFGSGPLDAGTVLTPQRSASGLRVSTRRAAHADRAWSSLRLADGTEREPSLVDWEQPGKTLRTRTITLDAPRVWLLVRGRGGSFAVVDGHRMVRPPLHQATVVRFDTEGRWAWVAHELGDYIGHRVHVELSPRPRPGADLDLSIALVVAADQPPSPAEPFDHASDVVQDLVATGADDKAAVAWAVDAWGAAVDALEEGAPDTVALTRLATLLAGEDLLSGGAVLANHGPNGHAEALAFAALEAAIQTTSRTAPALWDGNGVDELLLVRGSHRSPAGEVPRRFLQCLGGGDVLGGEGGSGRLALAERVTSPDHPLLARVFVNRVWHHLFGRGIVASVDDFGHQGTPPSHPELLDRLARDVIADGWSLKRLVERLVLSSTYRMGSAPVPGARERDPANTLWHHMSRRRLPGEVLRDAMLAVSGELDPTPFGASVPVNLTSFMDGRGKPPSGPLDGGGRRSVYLGVRRNFLHPMFAVFDAPQPAATVGRRSRSNVPAQALTLLNDPFVQHEARRWAEAELAEHPDAAPSVRVARLWLAALSRAPDDAEMTDVLAFLTAQGERHGLSTEGWRDDPRPWADLCHVVFNLKEFSFPG